jgi:hypothetical protein
MLKTLMLVSGAIEIVFGASALIVPLMVVEAVGGAGAGTPTLALIRLLGAATFGLGLAALLARNHLDTTGGLAAAYGLGLYNVLGARCARVCRSERRRCWPVGRGLAPHRNWCALHLCPCPPHMSVFGTSQQ